MEKNVNRNGFPKNCYKYITVDAANQIITTEDTAEEAEKIAHKTVEKENESEYWMAVYELKSFFQVKTNVEKTTVK